jgi:hypothetical protein
MPIAKAPTNVYLILRYESENEKHSCGTISNSENILKNND